MTLPYERSRAVRYTRQFLIDLLNPKLTPRVPLEVRRTAHRLLKHYPTEYDLALAAEQAPQILGDPDAPR